MGGTSSSDTNTSQTQQTTGNSTTAPWQPTQGILQNILGGIGGMSTAPNATQTQGANQLVSNAQSMPSFGTQAAGATNSLLGSLPQGVQSAYQTYQNQMNPIANQNNDPTQSPGMQAVLQQIQSDVGNSVNSQFAGAGRDMSGMNQQALARGISQGEAQPLLAQYNQNVSNQMGAAGSLYGAAGTNANTQAGLYGAGMQSASQLPSIYNQNANNLLQAGNTQAGLPAQNLGMLEGLTLPIAGLGSQNTANGTSMGTGQSNTTNQMSGAQQFGLISGGLASLWSDRRLKRDIAKVGELFDGTPVYRFRYLNDPAMHIGLMSDDVAPESVVHVGALHKVDYAKATQRALEMGVV